MTTNSRYTLPPEPPVSAWARHIDAVRRERNLSQTATFRLLREAVDLGPESRSAFLPYLVDKDPEADQAKRLAALIGWPPAEATTTPEPAPDMPTALLALANELRAAREGREAAERRLEAQARAIEALSDRLAALEGAASPTRSTPRASTGSAQ